MSRLAASPNAFLFYAAKPGGGRRFGMRSARSERALAQHLRADKLVLLRTWRMPAWVAPEKDFSLKDHAALNEQLAQLVSRGVPLVDALEVASTVVSQASQGRVLRMKELVAAGSSFSEACRKAGRFDRVTVAVYQAAEKTGDLAGAGQELAENARRMLSVRGKAATVMIYPAIVLTISLSAAFALLTLIVPTIGDSLADAGLTLPWYTNVVMAVGNALSNNMLLVLGVLIESVAAMVLGREVLKVWLSGIMRRLPLMRDVVLAQESARFFSVMGAMTRAGIPLADALGVAVEAIGHPAMRKDLGRMRVKLIEGGVLRRLIDEAESLPLATRRLLMAADQAGDLESAFSALAKDMADEVDKKTSRLLAALEPLLIVFMFLIIGSLVMAIMIPMMNLTGEML